MWDTWLHLATLISGRSIDQLESIRSAVDATSDRRTFAALAEELGISTDDVARLAADLGAADATAILDPPVLNRLLDCAAQIRRTGGDAATLARWRASPTTAGATRARQLALAADRRGAVAHRFAPGARRADASARRDALTEHWVRRTGVRDADELFGHLLVDPQMGTCSDTSRIRLAITSVQIFIHRVLMDLEPDVHPDAIDKGHWEWMQNYRVWEANRKVLLYPENWIEPDLRDGQTDPFRSLTTDLLQGDVTGDAADQALRADVDGLGEIGSTEIVGMCSEYVGHLLATVHVFGRTRHEPRVLSTRRFVKHAPADVTDATGEWTPWEPLNVDVEGDHLIPFVWRGRLFVFWPIFGEEASPPPPSTTSAGNQQPKKRLTMKLAWSERRESGWTALSAVQ